MKNLDINSPESKCVPTLCVTDKPFTVGALLFNEMNEIWVPVVGFEKSHLISSNGRIFSKFKEKILKQTIRSGRYAFVSIEYKKKRLSCSVHRLVAIHFIPNPENKRTINHINGIKTDNRTINLEWATYSENSLHSLNIKPRCKYATKKDKLLTIARWLKTEDLSINDIISYLHSQGLWR